MTTSCDLQTGKSVAFTLSLKILLVTVVTFCCSCSESQNEALPVSTPEEQLVNMYQALMDNDEKSFMACHHIATSKQKQLLKQVFVTMQKAKWFRDQYTNVYGKEVWGKPYDSKGVKESRFSIAVVSNEEFATIKNISMTHENGIASISIMDDFIKITLENEENGWLIQPSSWMSGFDIDDAILIHSRSVTLFDTMAQELKKDKIEREVFDQKFANAILQIVMRRR